MSDQASDLKSQPIGVFDSGVGGISVLRHIHAALPQEDLLCIADSHYAPYGTRSSEEILARCWTNADFLLAQGVKMPVVECNTATAAAIAPMRRKYAADHRHGTGSEARSANEQNRCHLRISYGRHFEKRTIYRAALKLWSQCHCGYSSVR